jgi:MFS family permease
VLSHVPRDLAEGLVFARGDVVIGGVLLVTMAMNFLGFSYAALIAPIGRQHFMLLPAFIGVLASAEAFGALLGGLWLASNNPLGNGRALMVGGSLLFLVCVALMPLSPNAMVAFALLTIGGVGSAAFANMQTSLIIMHAPPYVRSRLMGLLTVCIGMGPLGILMVGALASQLGPLLAVDVMALSGLITVLGAGLLWRRNEYAAVQAPSPGALLERSKVRAPP